MKTDLEPRTLAFARNVRTFLKELPKNQLILEDCKQLIRSSGSVGANYIEANESLGKKDFLMRIKICRKEAKESEYCLSLFDCTEQYQKECDSLKDEAMQLRKIFGSIITKSEL